MENRIPADFSSKACQDFAYFTRKALVKDLYILGFPADIGKLGLDYLPFSISKLTKKYASCNENFKLGLGEGDIGILQSPRTAWDGNGRADVNHDIEKIKYKLLNGTTLDDDEKKNFPNITKENLFSYGHAKTELDLLDIVSPRKLKWKGDHGTDYVISINMDCAFGWENVPDDLRKKMEQKAYEIADKYDLFLGSSSAPKGGCVGFPVGVDTFTLIPKDLESFSMEPLIQGIGDLGDFVLNLKL